MNRIEDDKCVACGFELLVPFNEFRLCRECLEPVLKAQYQTKMRTRHGKKPSKVVIASAGPNSNLKMTDEPLGTKV